MTKTIDKEVSLLKVDTEIIEFLKNNNINYIKDLCSLKRQELKKIGLKDRQIKQLIIQLELLGLGLNKKKSKV